MSENIIQRVVRLLKEQNRKDKEFCDFVGVAQSTFVNWKKRNTDPKPEYLGAIAQFLGISLEQLIIGEEISTKDTSWKPVITEKDEKDIKKKLDDLINQLSTDTGLMYDGEPMDEESLDAVRAALEVAERTAMLEARRKFTPNKYKK